MSTFGPQAKPLGLLSVGFYWSIPSEAPAPPCLLPAYRPQSHRGQGRQECYQGFLHFSEISKFLLDIPRPICLRFSLKEKSWDKVLISITFIFISKRVTHKAIPEMGIESHG